MKAKINHSWWTKMARKCLHKHNWGWQGKDFYGMYVYCMKRRVTSKL